MGIFSGGAGVFYSTNFIAERLKSFPEKGLRKKPISTKAIDKSGFNK